MWSPLLVLVAVLSATGAASERSRFHSCQLFWGSECCRFAPNCSSPSSIICDSRQCSNRSIVLGDSISTKTVSSIGVSHIRTFTLGSRNMELSTLRRIVIQDVEEVELQSWATLGMEESVAMGPLSVEIKRIQTLSIGSEVFSNGWNINSLISVGRIRYLKLSPLAFSPKASVGTVVLANIGSLEMESSTFSSKIKSLIFRNVTMRQCPAGAIGGTVEQMLLQGLTINVTRSGCLTAKKGWKRVILQNSKIGTIQKNSFTGNINTFQINQTEIGHIRKRGFSLQTSMFEVDQCLIRKLSSTALNITSEKGVTFQRSNITVLRRNAFSSVSSSTNLKAVFNINQLIIDQVQNRSLAFAKATNLSLHNIRFNTPCQCPAWKMARRLIYGKSSPGKYKGLIRKVVLNSQCLHPAKNGTYETKSLAEYGCKYCKGKCPITNTTTITPNTSLTLATIQETSGTSTQRWLPFVLVAMAVLLVVMTCLILLLSQRRRRLYKVMHYLKRNQLASQSASSAGRLSRPHHLNIVAVRPANPESEDDFTDGFETDDFDDDISNGREGFESDDDERTYENLQDCIISHELSSDQLIKGKECSKDNVVDAGYATLSELGRGESSLAAFDIEIPTMEDGPYAYIKEKDIVTECTKDISDNEYEAGHTMYEHIVDNPQPGIDTLEANNLASHTQKRISMQGDTKTQENTSQLDDTTTSTEIAYAATEDCRREVNVSADEKCGEAETHCGSLTMASSTDNVSGEEWLGLDIDYFTGVTSTQTAGALSCEVGSRLSLHSEDAKEIGFKKFGEVIFDETSQYKADVGDQYTEQLPIYAVVKKANRTAHEQQKSVVISPELSPEPPELPPPLQPIYAKVNRNKRPLLKTVSCDIECPQSSSPTRLPLRTRSVHVQRPQSSLELRPGRHRYNWRENSNVTARLQGLQMTENGLYGSWVLRDELEGVRREEVSSNEK